MAKPHLYYPTWAAVPEAVKRAYAEGTYAMPAPPVQTTQWDSLSWINFITQCGHWGLAESDLQPVKESRDDGATETHSD